MVHSESKLPLIGGEVCQGHPFLFSCPGHVPVSLVFSPRTTGQRALVSSQPRACLAEAAADPVTFPQERYLEVGVGTSPRGLTQVTQAACISTFPWTMPLTRLLHPQLCSSAQPAALSAWRCRGDSAGLSPFLSLFLSMEVIRVAGSLPRKQTPNCTNEVQLTAK